MKQATRCDGTILDIVKAEISGDIYAWDFWYYTDKDDCIFGLEIEEDLQDIIILNKYIEKWTKKLRKTDDNKKFSFVIYV